MDKRVFKLTPTNRRFVAENIRDSQDGYVVTISEPPKSRPMEAAYHAMIGDIANQCAFMGRRRDAESWKRLLVEAFVNEMREEARMTGNPDPFVEQGEVIPSLDGRRVVQLGVQTRTFTQRIASSFIEYLNAFGAEQGVRFTAPKNSYQ